MSDEEFDSFEAEDGDRDDVQPIDDGEIQNFSVFPLNKNFSDEIADRHRPRDRCDLSMAMTQKLFGNPGGSNVNQVEYEESAYVEPRNRFEEILKEENVRIINEQEDGMMDMDVGEKCVVFGGNLNHEELIRNLERRMETDRGELFREFEIACEESQETLQLYLSPSKSPLGLQDTIFRAFLQIRSTQTKSFDLLLQKLNILAKKTEESDLFLAQTCVAHMRHLNRLFEPQAVFNTIFEFEWRFWSPNVRNDLIAALPEVGILKIPPKFSYSFQIFTDIALQQHTALRLNKEIAETQGISDLPSFQLQIVETLRLLRMDQAVSRQIRMNLCNSCMELDVHCLPQIIAFSLASLLNSGGKTDDDEMNFHEMLRQLSRLLKIETLKKKTNKSDTIVTEIFAHFLKFLQLDKRYWKYIISWISRKAKNLTIKDEPGEEEVTEEEPPEDPATWLTTFEAFLIFSLLSNSDSCPHGFVAAVNTKFLTVPTAFTTKFLKIVDLMISFKRFSASHFSALIHVARHCFWSPDSTIRQMGVSLWKQLFVGMEKKERVKSY
ncbi:hypothetical protein CRE_17542 [Caenorhabditis remanei]|uniref:Uncharacterized protein n=1 Tax=Caenorhabditis remanei TaxID=31234 RepID=E3NC11_CAERE|nr:hypothetical protein CRE_17542 [Caenorhabditis remanei]